MAGVILAKPSGGGGGIAINGTSTTTAAIPFAEGLSIASTKSVRIGGSTDAIARGKLHHDANSLILTALTNSGAVNGASTKILGGDAAQTGDNGAGGMVYLKGGTFDALGDTLVSGFTATGDSMTSFTATNGITGESFAENSRDDFGVANNLYVAGRTIFSGGIGVGGRLAPTTGWTLLGQGQVAQIIGLDRHATAGGVTLTIQAGWGRAAATNANAGNLILAPGKATGSGSGAVEIQAVGAGTSGTTDRTPSTVATFAIDKQTLADAYNITFGKSVGTKIGTATDEKLAFHNSTPVVQRVGAAQVAVANTGATNTTPFGYTTAAQANAIVTLLNEIRAALVEKGIIKGAA